MTGEGIVVPAWAKINLVLEVGTRGQDGYHPLDTVLHSVALHDEVHLEVARAPTTSIEVEVEGDDSVPAGPANLAFRAAEMLLQETGVTADVKVVLHKRIPSGAGLGGGSADAGAVLAALNQILDLRVREERLLEMGGRIGSDVPFTVRGGTARAWGRGQHLAPLPTAHDFWVVLVKPDFAIDTAWCYGRWAESGLRTTRETVQHMVTALMQKRFQNICDALNNDLEGVVFPAYPILGELKQRLLHLGCSGSLMTGSGSCVFGLTEHRSVAYRVAEVLEDQVAGRIIVTHSLERERE